jgi:hypothetical protein
MGDLVFAFCEPFIVPEELIRMSMSEEGERQNPWQGMAQRLVPRREPHMPPPSTRFSARAFVVLRVVSSALLQ